jgi:sigma-E factor negative regulatory protein RseB
MRVSAGHQAACLCFALGVAQAAAAEEPVRDWLDRMSHALNNLDYEGTFVYQNDSQLESIQVVHIVNDDGEHERVYSLNGAPREIIRTPDAVRCILPDDESIVVERRLTQDLFPTLPPSQVGDLEDYYRFQLIGDDRVADLQTKVLGIEPRDRFRYGYRLWLEKDTGMLLRSELVADGGEAIEQMMFTSITLGESVPMKALESQLGGYKAVFGPRPPGKEPPESLKNVHESNDKALEWSVDRLPPGFHLKSHGRHDDRSNDSRSGEHMVFTDGLASVSVHVELAGDREAAAPDGISHMGAINAFSRVHQKHRVTVVGEVPPVTVRTIAHSVKRRTTSASIDD